MLDIIIPAYNAHKTIEKTLLSICAQDVDFDFNVYICNDCSNKDYSKVVNKFKKFINIEEIKLDKNSGPGVARQIGIDNSTSDYIVFIDADDELYSVISLKTMYNAIKETNSDVLICSFIEETDNEYVMHDEDHTWLHGKIYKRKFIEDNKIRFNDSYSNEDTYFNKSIFIRDAKVEYLDFITYIWKNNKESITRRNNKEYDIKGMIGYIDNMTKVIDEAINDNVIPENIAEYTFCFLYAVYFCYLQYHDNKVTEQLIDTSRKLKDYFVKYEKLYPKLNKDMYEEQYEYFKKTSNDIRISEPYITVDEFLKVYNS